MKAVQQWTLIICLASLVAALVQSILPNGGMERMGRFVMGAFLICVMIEPIARFVPSLRVNLQSSADTSTSDGSKIQATLNSQVEEQSKKSISNLVTAELARLGIKCKNVRVDMDTTGDGRINISKVVIRLNRADTSQTEQAQKYLEKELGLKTEVVADGG